MNISNQKFSGLTPWPSPAYEDKTVLLASNSPRRRELLGLVLPHFVIAGPREVEESYPADMEHAEVPAYLSQLKASAYVGDLTPDRLLITADTVVLLDGRILGKPRDADQARAMLRSLSGRSHTVVTGVSLTSTARRDTFSEHTQVHFAPLSEAEIDVYVERFRPFDKAGAYGIQEWIGAAAITGIDGCFYNVMGLPLNALYRHLRDFY